MRSNKNLNSTLCYLQNRSCNSLDDLGVEVGLRLIPEKIPFIKERSGCDQTGNNGEFTQPLCHKVHLHRSRRQMEIKSIFLIFDISAHRFFQRNEKPLYPSLTRSSR